MLFALETLLVEAMLKSVLKTLVTSSSQVTGSMIGVAPLFNYFHHHIYGFHRNIKWMCSLGHELDNQQDYNCPCSTLPARRAWQSYSFSHPQNSILFLLPRDLRKYIYCILT